MISLLSLLTSGIINGQTNRVFSVVVGVIALGGIIGMINGLIILKLRIHPLIVTLGMGAVLQGLTLLYSRTPIGGVPLDFDYIAYGRVANIPVGATATVVIFIIVAVFLRYTPIGRYIYAIGDDAEAASILGLPIKQTIIFVYGFSGICCAMTAIYLVARFGVGQPYTGVNYTLASITPVIIGGTILSGGKGGVVGTLLGVYLISLLNNLLNFLDISTHLQLVVQGLIIITAVSIYVEKKREVS
jgi:ribose transport system permease protein